MIKLISPIVRMIVLSNPALRERENTTKRLIAALKVIAGIALVLLGLFLSVYFGIDVIENRNGPKSMALAKAAQVIDSDQTYARITDGFWDCDTLIHMEPPAATVIVQGAHEYNRSTEIFFTDDAHEVVVFVDFSGTPECDELADDPVGYLRTMDADERQEFASKTLPVAYAQADTLLYLCPYCGPENSLMGVGMGIFCIVFGLALIFAEFQ